MSPNSEAVLLVFTDEDICDQNMQEVDIKHEVLAVETDSYNIEFNTSSPSDDSDDNSDDTNGHQGNCPPKNCFCLNFL